MATKYFGYTRRRGLRPAFALKDTDFANYDPSKVMTSVEMTEERPPLQWWPTETDLTAIRAIPFNEALVLAKRWPASAVLGGTFDATTLAAGSPTGDAASVVVHHAAGLGAVAFSRLPQGIRTMTIEAWSLLVCSLMSLSLAIGPWMFKVHAKLAVIASKIVDLCEKLEETSQEHRRLWEVTARHASRLDTHDVQLSHIAERLRDD